MKAPLIGLATASALSGLGTGMILLAIPWFVLAATGGHHGEQSGVDGVGGRRQPRDRVQRPVAVAFSTPAGR